MYQIDGTRSFTKIMWYYLFTHNYYNVLFRLYLFNNNVENEFVTLFFNDKASKKLLWKNKIKI